MDEFTLDLSYILALAIPSGSIFTIASSVSSFFQAILQSEVFGQRHIHAIQAATTNLLPLNAVKSNLTQISNRKF